MARAAGVTRATIHQYFDGCEGLRRAVCERILARELADTPDVSPSRWLREWRDLLRTNDCVRCAALAHPEVVIQGLKGRFGELSPLMTCLALGVAQMLHAGDSCDGVLAWEEAR